MFMKWTARQVMQVTFPALDVETRPYRVLVGDRWLRINAVDVVDAITVAQRAGVVRELIEDAP